MIKGGEGEQTNKQTTFNMIINGMSTNYSVGASVVDDGMRDLLRAFVHPSRHNNNAKIPTTKTS